ncbi:MAG: hypothetical protein R2865_17510 [Deinococcales bacterium]
MWALQRQQSQPFETHKAKLCLKILQELDLVDERGVVKRGEKRDPYGSSSLRKGPHRALSKLRALVNSYKHSRWGKIC